jgi:hypothetical protein
MISTDAFQRPHFHANRASARPCSCQQAQRALIVFQRLQARRGVRIQAHEIGHCPEGVSELDQALSTHGFRAPRRAPLFNERTQTMFSNVASARHKATLQNLIDQVINAGLIALVGCSIAAALVIGVPMSAGGSQIAMPTSEWRSLFDQRVFRASSHEWRMQRLVGTVNAPIGQGWG